MKATKTSKTKVYKQVVNELNKGLKELYDKTSWFELNSDRTYFTIGIDYEGLSAIYFGNLYMHKESHGYQLEEFADYSRWKKEEYGGKKFLIKYIMSLYNHTINEMNKIKFTTVIKSS